MRVNARSITPRTDTPIFNRKSLERSDSETFYLGSNLSLASLASLDNDSEYSFSYSPYSDINYLESPGIIRSDSTIGTISYKHLNDLINTFKSFVSILNDKNYYLKTEEFIDYLGNKLSKSLSQNYIDNEFVIEFQKLFIKTILVPGYQNISGNKNEICNTMLKEFGEKLENKFC